MSVLGFSPGPHILALTISLSSIFLQAKAENAPAAPAAEGFDVSQISFVKAIKAAAPSTVTVAVLEELDAEKRKLWEGFSEEQRRILSSANAAMEVAGKWYEPLGHGSGFIIDDAGHIVTNDHVVAASGRKVVYAVCVGTQNKWHAAKLTGRDPATDLAVLQASTIKAPPVTWGDSTALQQGDIVFAIGTPRDLDLRQTATMGIVSATGRATRGLLYEDFIQTDASINSGNSGGPLINVKGQVVGVNQSIILARVTQADGTAAETDSGGSLRAEGNIGLGLAIPSSLAKRVVTEIIEHGQVRRGYLGVKVDEGFTDTAGLPTAGLRVSTVLGGSPAEKAGLKVGDLIVEYDTRPVTSVRNFHLAVSLGAPSASVTLAWIRDAKVMTEKVTLGDLAATRYAAIGFDPSTAEAPELEGVEMTPFSHPTLGDGLVIRRVAEGSPAAKAGLVAPCVLTAVAGVPVASVEEFSTAASTSAQGGYVLLTVRSVLRKGLGEPKDISVPIKKN